MLLEPFPLALISIAVTALITTVVWLMVSVSTRGEVEVPIRGECNTSSDCGIGELCVNHTCKTACTQTSDCPFGNLCVAGSCAVPPSPGLCTRGTCPSGWVCDGSTSRCLPLSPTLNTCSGTGTSTCAGTCSGETCIYPSQPGISCTVTGGFTATGVNTCPYTGDAYPTQCSATPTSPGTCFLGSQVSLPTSPVPISVLLPGVGSFFLTASGPSVGLISNSTGASLWNIVPLSGGTIGLTVGNTMLVRNSDGTVSMEVGSPTSAPSTTPNAGWLASSVGGGIVLSDPGISWVLAVTGGGALPVPGLSPIPPFSSPAVLWYLG